MKKLIFLAAAMAGAAIVKKWQESEAEKSAWSKETDKVD
ncbi:DLW-39 family protein [Arthrobacter mobilis]|nr:DLW-39 family protein [Arthrobacter mobilis]